MEVEKKYCETENIQEESYFKNGFHVWAVMSLWNCVNECDISYLDLKVCVRTFITLKREKEMLKLLTFSCAHFPEGKRTG